MCVYLAHTSHSLSRKVLSRSGNLYMTKALGKRPRDKEGRAGSWGKVRCPPSHSVGRWRDSDILARVLSAEVVRGASKKLHQFPILRDDKAFSDTSNSFPLFFIQLCSLALSLSEGKPDMPFNFSGTLNEASVFWDSNGQVTWGKDGHSSLTLWAKRMALWSRF